MTGPLTLLLTAYLAVPSEATLAQTKATAACLPSVVRAVFGYSGAASSEGDVSVVVRAQDLSTSGLRCLGRSFQKEHPEWIKGSIDVFTDQDAAEHFDPSGMSVPDVNAYWRRHRQFVAAYTFDRQTGREALLLMPLGWSGRRQLGEIAVTELNVSGDSVPSCPLAVAGRCVLVMDWFTYPGASVAGDDPVTVTVSGRVSRAGSVRDVRVRKSGEASVPAAYTRAAVDHLKSWRLDPAAREDAVQIAYRFQVAPGDTGTVSPSIRVDMDLPRQVTVTMTRARQ